MADRMSDSDPLNMRLGIHVGGYSWSSDHVLSPVPLQGRLPEAIRGAPNGPWLVTPVPWGAEQRVRVYNLSRRRRDLHLEFARLEPHDDAASLDAMRRFAARFGMLGVDEALVYPSEGRSGHPKVISTLYSAEHLSTWIEAISSVRGLNELIHACKTADMTFLKEHVHWQTRPLRVEVSYVWPGRTTAPRRWLAREGPEGWDQDKLAAWNASREPEHHLEPMLEYLYDELNERLGLHVAPRLFRERGVVLEPKSLLGALYMLAAEQLAGSWPTKVCPGCGVFFVPRRRRDQKTCSDACRKRLSRSRDEGQS